MTFRRSRNAPRCGQTFVTAIEDGDWIDHFDYRMSGEECGGAIIGLAKLRN